MIQTAEQKDLTQIARCHRLAFPGSITSLLGISFIRDMLQWYLSAPNKFLFWIEEDGKCIGYCGGFILDGSDAYGSASGMSQFGFGAAVKVMLRKPWLFFHPEIRSRYPFIIINLKRKLKKLIPGSSKAIQQPDKKKEQNTSLLANLVVIGVDPAFQKKGIGSVLQQEFERRAQTYNAKSMRLSVRKENIQAIASYKRNGWTVIADEVISYRMAKEIS